MPTPDNPHLALLQRLRAMVSETDEQRPDQIDEDIARKADNVLTRLANVLDEEIERFTVPETSTDYAPTPVAGSAANAAGEVRRNAIPSTGLLAVSESGDK